MKLGKREREVDRLEKDLEDAKYKTAKCERICYDFECRVKALEASLNWWEGKDREKRRAVERRKQEDIEIERRGNQGQSETRFGEEAKIG